MDRPGIRAGDPASAEGQGRAGRLAAAALCRLASPRRLRRERGERQPVTLLLLFGWGLGGTIRTTFNLAGELAGSREVEILSVVRRGDETFFDLPDGVTMTAVDDQRAGREAKGPLGWVQRRLRARPSVLVSRHDRAHDACTLWTDVRLALALRRRRGILVGTRPALNLLAADLAGHGRIVVGQQHMPFRRYPAPMRELMRAHYPRLDAVTVLTPAQAVVHRRELGEGVRVICIPNAVPALPGPPSPLTEPVVLAAGRLGNQKGFDLLIRAFEPVARRHPDWRLAIYGKGAAHEALERMAAERGLAGRVTLPGAVRNLHEEMERASIFALSSRFEGFPMVLLEAMAKGLPVVSFDCETGPGDVVDDGRNGLLVPAGDVAALGAAIERLIEDEPLRRRFAVAGRSTVTAYSAAAVGARWEGLLADLEHAAAPAARGRSVLHWHRGAQPHH